MNVGRPFQVFGSLLTVALYWAEIGVDKLKQARLKTGSEYGISGEAGR